MMRAGGNKQLPDAAVIAICFAIPPALVLILVYAPTIVLLVPLVGLLWIGVSAWLINLAFLARDAGEVAADLETGGGEQPEPAATLVTHEGPSRQSLETAL